nr:MFS transporter [Sphingopyxis macrogoltabida]
MSGATDPAQAASADDNTPPPIIRKVANRIMWWLIALYFVAILDRGNVAYAAVPMSQALGLSTAMFGFGVGIMYLTYSLFEVPSNMMLARFGARLTLTRIAVLWGLCTTALAAVWSAESFYVLRAILGAAEAGLFPGVMLYLTFWFPVAYRARYGPVATPFAARMAAHQPHRRLSLDRPRCAIVRPQAASPDARRRRSGETLAYIWVRSMYRPQTRGKPLCARANASMGRSGGLCATVAG